MRRFFVSLFLLVILATVAVGSSNPQLPAAPPTSQTTERAQSGSSADGSKKTEQSESELSAVSGVAPAEPGESNDGDAVAGEAERSTVATYAEAKDGYEDLYSSSFSLERRKSVYWELADAENKVIDKVWAAYPPVPYGTPAQRQRRDKQWSDALDRESAAVRTRLSSSSGMTRQDLMYLLLEGSKKEWPQP